MQIGYEIYPDSLRLFAWHEVDNFGDRLGPALFHLISQRPVYIEARGLHPTFQGPAREIHCFLGTLAHVLEGPHRFVLWGFGTSPPEGPAHHGCRPMTPGLDLDIRALRGALTRAVLEQAGYAVPDAVPYGDPGLLTPGFYKRSPVETDDFCLVPHHNDYDRWRWDFPGFNVVDIRTPTYDTLPALILEITKYRLVFTSSLHVAILAEAFGVPVQPVAPKLPFKLDDFYSAVGKRVEYLPALSPSADWPMLYRSALRDWRPVVWDPAPWLSAAPFSVSPHVCEALQDHYAKLAKARRSSNATMSSRRRTYYRALQSSLTPAKKSPDLPSHVIKVFGPEEWIVSDSGESEAMQQGGADGRFHAAMPRHVSTEFLSVAGAAEVIIRTSLDHIDGAVEILAQNEEFVTRASTSVQAGEPAGVRTLSVIPADDSERLRACVVFLWGSVTVGPIEVLARRRGNTVSAR